VAGAAANEVADVLSEEVERSEVVDVVVSNAEVTRTLELRRRLVRRLPHGKIHCQPWKKEISEVKKKSRTWATPSLMIYIVYICMRHGTHPCTRSFTEKFSATFK
jgi:hypothetical protein